MRHVLEDSQVRYGNASRGAKTKSQVCEEGKFLDELLIYSVSRGQGTVICSFLCELSQGLQADWAAALCPFFSAF